MAMQNAMLVVLSDVWLDSPSVLSQLATLFEGYEAVGSATVGSGRAAVPLASSSSGVSRLVAKSSSITCSPDETKEGGEVDEQGRVLRVGSASG